MAGRTGDLRLAVAQPIRPAAARPPGPAIDSVSQLTASALVHTLAPDMERTRSQFNVFGPNIQ